MAEVEGGSSGTSALTLYAAGGLVVAAIIGSFTHAQEQTLHIPPLAANIILSIFAGFMTHKLMRVFRPILVQRVCDVVLLLPRLLWQIKAGMYGIDLNKNRTDPPTPVYVSF